MFRRMSLLCLASTLGACGLPHTGPYLARGSEVATPTGTDSRACIASMEANPYMSQMPAAQPYYFARCMTDKGWEVKYEHNWYHFRGPGEGPAIGLNRDNR